MSERPIRHRIAKLIQDKDLHIIEIINSVPFPMVVISDSVDSEPSILFKNSECITPDPVLIDSYINGDPLLNSRERILKMDNGDVLWQYSRNINGESIIFDVIYRYGDKCSVPSKEDRKAKRDASAELISASINKLKNINSRLEDMIMSKIDYVTPETRDRLLAKRGISV